MYEAKVKYRLVSRKFDPAAGWHVNVHLDPMEICRGGTPPEGKKRATSRALEQIKAIGAEIGIDRDHGVDVRAEHPTYGLYLIEVKGESSQQKELGLYSALGQLLTKIGEPPWGATFGLAFPDTKKWVRQVEKLPPWLIAKLDLRIFLVSADRAREWSRSAAV